MVFINCLNAEVFRWFLWWPVGMGAGIATYFTLPFEPHLISVLFIFLCISVSLIWNLYYFRHASFQNETSIRFFLYGFLSIIIGFTVAKIRTDTLSTPMLGHQLNDVFITGTIKDIEHPPYKKGNKRRILLGDVSYEEKQKGLPHTVRLNIADHLIEGKPGDLVRCKADLLPISFPLSLFGYDFQQQAYFAGIGAVGRGKKACELVEIAQSTPLSRLRYQLTQTLRKEIPGVNGQIAAALVTGDRSGIPKEVRQNFIDAGIAHILAISGLHISLVAGLIFLIVRRGFALIPFFVERFFVKKWAAIVSIFATSGYLAISGFGFPAQRAFFMTALVMVGICLDRNPISMRSLSIAATFILLLFPESILSISFQLSFAAVIALIATYEGGWTFLKNWIAGGHWYRKYLGHSIGIVLTTVVATLATTPLVIYTFNRFTLQAIAGNLLAIPLMSLLIMPTVLLAVLSLVFGKFIWIFKILDLWLSLLVFAAEKIAHWPGAAILVATPHYLFIVLTTFGGLWLCLWKEKWRWLGLVPICFSGFFIFYDHHPHIYITDEVIAYRSGKTLNLSSVKRGTFASDIWAKELGLTEIKLWNSQVIYYPSDVSKITLISNPYLDEKGQKRSYEETDAYVSQYCSHNPRLISNGYVWRVCRDKIAPSSIIDRFQLSRRGGHYLWVYPNAIKVVNAAEYFGKRPWRVRVKKIKKPKL
ncbi:MAG: ComEC family competence protein [Alphaproteobacteria bacterium]|nr:ComEC family competence protein [Alphaproteobacteria bacterium]